MKKILVVFCFLCALVGKAQNFEEALKKSTEYFKARKHDKAIEVAEQAINKARKKDKKNFNYLAACNYLTFLYIESDEIKKGKEICKDTYKRLKLLNKKKHEQYSALFVEAKLYYRYLFSLKDNKANEKKHEELYRMLADLYSFDASFIQYVANYYKEKGNYLQADFFYSKAIKMLNQQSDDYVDKSTILLNMGATYHNLGLLNKAGEYYAKALEMTKKIEDISTKTNFLGYLAIAVASLDIDLKMYDTAGSLIDKSLKDWSDNFSDENILPLTLFTAGYLFLEQKNYKSAKHVFEGLYNLTNKELPIYYTYSNFLAVTYTMLEEYDKAEAVYKENLKNILKNEINNSKYIGTLTNMSWLYLLKKDYKNATKYYKQIIGNKTNFMLKNLFFMEESEKFQYMKQYNFISDGFQELALKTHEKQPAITTDLFNLLMFEKRIILFNTINIKQIIENSDNKDIKSKYQELKNIKYNITNKKIDKGTLNLLKLKAEKIQREISLLIKSKYTNNDLVDLFDVNKIQNNISKNEAVIQFINFDNTYEDTTYYCALIVKKNLKNPKLVYLCTQKELKNALGKETPITNTAQHIKNIYDTDNKLYKYLFEKIEPYIKGIETINISPSGLVHNVAFSCLKNNSGEFLKDKYLINYYMNFSDLCNNEKNISINSKNTHQAVLFGDMKYDLNSEEIQKINSQTLTRGINSSLFFENNNFNLTPLPDTKHEVDSIANIFSKNNISCKKYTGTEANEDNFYKLDASNTDILHIATHGFYFANEKKQRRLLPEMPNLNPVDNSYFKNGLFFSGASNSLKNEAAMEKISDGILSAYEICNLNLANVKLVVLSACLTGMGDIKQNEGVIGLSRAFKIAGAKYLLISLWEIPSRQTSEFMINFYKNMLSGISIEQAFNKTQKIMSKKYKNPYFWGGFILLK